MGEIDNLEIKPRSKYVIWLAIFVSVLLGFASVLLGFRFFTSPEAMQTAYTPEEQEKIAIAEAILKSEPYLASESEIALYLDSLELGFSSDSSCSEHPKSFKNQQDMFGYHSYQLSLMQDIDGSGSCVTFSGFPISEISNSQKAVQELKRSVVIVYSGRGSRGTGFVLSDNTVFTNFHVANDDNDKPHSRIEIETLDGATYSAEYVSGSLTTDSAILKTTGRLLNTVPVKFSNQPLAYGEPVIAIGHPSGAGYWVSSVGIYYGERNNIFDKAGPRFSLPSSPGGSGSPIFNLKGELVGAVYGSNDVSKLSARTSDEARYQVPLHRAIVSAYIVLAGVSLEDIRLAAGLSVGSEGEGTN